MKSGIHPEYEVARITCACGRVTETRSTVGEIHVEICSHCHPFFTGRQKLVDTAGRVERFLAKYGSGTEESGEASAAETGASEKAAEAAEAAEAPSATATEAPPVEEAVAESEAADTSEPESATADDAESVAGAGPAAGEEAAPEPGDETEEKDAAQES